MKKKIIDWYLKSWRRAWNDTDHLEMHGEYGYAFTWLMAHAMLVVMLVAFLFAVERWGVQHITGGALP